MLWRWQDSSSSRTCTGSPDSFPRPASAASSAIPTPWSSPSSDAEKNGLLCLWPAPLDLLRPTAPPCPRPLLWRQAGLPRLLPSQSPLPAVPPREDRTPRMARRQSLLYQTLRLLRRPAVSRDTYQGSRRRTLPRLAYGQGSGQAV